MPRILYYVVRQSRDGQGCAAAAERLVPMVPMDQLPDWLDIVGVPRKLSAEHATGMTPLLDLGRTEAPDGLFEVQLREGAPAVVPEAITIEVVEKAGEQSINVSETTSEVVPCLVTDISAPASDTASSATIVASTLTTQETGKVDNKPDNKPDDKPDDKLPTKTPAARAADPGTDNKSDKPPKQTKSPSTRSPRRQGKNYKFLPCKNWCQTGYCYYKETCRFAHVMPLTRESLRAVDLDELPQWYTKKYGTQPQNTQTQTTQTQHTQHTQHTQNTQSAIRTTWQFAKRNADSTKKGKTNTAGRNSPGSPASKQKTAKPGIAKDASPPAAMEDLIDLS